jgi:uracil-DNA glycosylase
MANLFSIVIQDNQSNKGVEKTIVEAIEYFENLYPAFRKELDEHINGPNSTGLQNRIVYDTQSPVNLEQASIDHWGEIHITKSFLLLIWAICIVIPKVFHARQHSDSIDDELWSQLIRPLQFYLKNLTLNVKKRRSRSGKPYIGEILYEKLGESVLFDTEYISDNYLFFNALSVILCHEFAHHKWGDTTAGPVANRAQMRMELQADVVSFEYMISAIGSKRENRTIDQISIGSILGIGSLLFIYDHWSGYPKYPDIDTRLAKLIETLENSLEAFDRSDFWDLGVTILEVWAKVYQKKLPNKFKRSSSKERFEELALELKVLQKPILKPMFNLYFKPFIGKEYNNQSPKVLILGESHYAGEGDETGGDFTNYLIKRYAKREGGERRKFFTTIAKSIDNQLTNETASTFWDKVAFYNYIQTSVGSGPRVRPTLEMFDRSRDALKQAVAFLKPDIIVVLGKQLGQYLSFHDVYFNFDLSELIICQWNHPSSPKYFKLANARAAYNKAKGEFQKRSLQST